MRLLTVRHVTIYRYSEPVGLGEHRMMFRPRESHDLRLIKTRLNIMPKPKHLRWLHDVFDNSVAIATFSGRTSELRFESTVTLEHVETALPDYALDPDAKTYPFAYPSDDRPDLTRALKRHCPATDVDHWAASFLAPSGSTGTIALLRSMTLGIREQFVYSRRIERDVQTPSETLQRGRGTCRDFALLMIEGVRSLGLAARFTESAVTDWKDRGQMESKSSGITFLSEPKVYTVSGIHGSDTAYRYRARKTASLSDAQLDILQRYGLHDIYRASVEACVRDLGLDAATTDRLFGNGIGAAA